MSLDDPNIRRLVVGQTLEGFVGDKVYVIRFLTSEKGRLLNNRRCVVTGHNGERLQVKLQDDGSVCSVRMQNLLGADVMYAPHQGPAVPDDEARQLLQAAYTHSAVQDAAGRRDVAGRMAFVRGHLDQGRVPPASACMDPMTPLPTEPDVSDFVGFMQKMRPCCHGDGMADFRRFNAGLIGSVGGSTCAVCLEELAGGQGALGFPCGHLFHRQCASGWLAQHNTCPSCRLQLGMPGHEYSYMLSDYEERLRIRIREWFISGMCERCQAAFHETDPLCGVDGPDGRTVLVPRSRLGSGTIVD